MLRRIVLPVVDSSSVPFFVLLLGVHRISVNSVRVPFIGTIGGYLLRRTRGAVRRASLLHFLKPPCLSLFPSFLLFLCQFGFFLFFRNRFVDLAFRGRLLASTSSHHSGSCCFGLVLDGLVCSSPWMKKDGDATFSMLILGGERMDTLLEPHTDVGTDRKDPVVGLVKVETRIVPSIIVGRTTLLEEG